MYRRTTSLAVCLLALGVSGVARAQTPTPEPSAAPVVMTTPAAVTPAEIPANPSPGVSPVPAATPKILYPSTSVSSLFGASKDGGSAGPSGLATTFLVLLGLCAAGYYLSRRHPAFAANFKGAARKLVVNESRSLGNRQFLVVVEYESERMLLGVTPGKIDYLCPLRGPHGEPGAFPPIKEGGA